MSAHHLAVRLRVVSRHDLCQRIVEGKFTAGGNFYHRKVELIAHYGVSRRSYAKRYDFLSGTLLLRSVEVQVEAP